MPANPPRRTLPRGATLVIALLATTTAAAAWPGDKARAQDSPPGATARQAPDSPRTDDPPRPTVPSATKPKAPQAAQGAGSPAASPSKATVPPQVMSKAAADARRPRSSLLLPPGYASSPQDRYNGEELDWSELPAWRQSSFFGIHARGQFFIYVLDQSGSMIDEDRLTRAKIELRRSVNALQPPQRFEVLFYNDRPTPMPGGPIPRSADQRTKDQLKTWLRLIGPEGETEPLTAIAQALALRPDAVFLLSDGDFPDGTVEAIARANTKKVPIHCVDLAAGLAGDHLKRIARDSGGVYASRPGSLHAAP